MRFEINEIAPSQLLIKFLDSQTVLEVERIPCTAFPGLRVKLVTTQPIGWVELGDDGIVIQGQNAEQVCTWLYFCYSAIKRRWNL
jgi:hypothetical protein